MRLAACSLAILLLACSSSKSPVDGGEVVANFPFIADAPAVGDEAYVCIAFDAAPARDKYVRAIRWTPPAGPVALHHATLYAAGATGIVDCERAGDAASSMHIWAPGGDDLVLPNDVGVSLPSGTTRLIVQAHVLRSKTGDATAGSFRLTLSTTPPKHLAAWLPAVVPVPALRPHQLETASARCRVGKPLHLLSSWPHMHRIGREIHGAIVRVDGTRLSIADVSPWNFDRQRTYPLDVDLGAGDVVETKCVWQNDSDDYVLPGSRSSDEMCNQGLIAWPADAARWEDCP